MARHLSVLLRGGQASPAFRGINTGIRQSLAIVHAGSRFTRLLEAAVLTSALFVVIVLTSLAYNPRLWIQDFPAAMQAELAPLTRGERVVRALLAPVLVLVVVGVPLLSVLHLESVRGEVTFLEGFLHVWLVFMAVNIVDLVLVDWLIGVRWQPEFLSMPEIDPVLGHNTYRFHAVEHVKGTVLLTAVALVLGGLVAAT